MTTNSDTRSRTWRGLAAGLTFAALAVPASPAAAESAKEEPDPAVERTGDYLQVGIPLVALGLTFLLGGGEAPDGSGSPFSESDLALDTEWLRMNGSPRHDLMLAIGRTELATYTLKYSVDEERPNGGGQSFPSGHTSVAFAGAEFIRKQYGWWWGVPSYLAASYVGWSRVETQNHWTRDVLAGAAIGILSNHDGLNFQVPTGRGGYGMLSVAPTLMGAPRLLGFDPPDPANEALDTPVTVAPGLHFSFRF